MVADLVDIPFFCLCTSALLISADALTQNPATKLTRANLTLGVSVWLFVVAGGLFNLTFLALCFLLALWIHLGHLNPTEAVRPDLALFQGVFRGGIPAAIIPLTHVDAVTAWVGPSPDLFFVTAQLFGGVVTVAGVAYFAQAVSKPPLRQAALFDGALAAACALSPLPWSLTLIGLSWAGCTVVRTYKHRATSKRLHLRVSALPVSILSAVLLGHSLGISPNSLAPALAAWVCGWTVIRHAHPLRHLNNWPAPPQELLDG